jgi:hypothetical protein
MDDQIRASLVLGATEYADRIRIVWREQLQQSPRMPQRTREKAFPEHIDVAGPDGKSRQLWPDGKMFLVHNKNMDTYAFVHGYEADTGTESIATRIREKFENYIYVVINKLQETYFGADENYYFMFLFSNQNRLHDGMVLFEQMTANKTSLRKHGSFKVHPLYNDQPKPRATGHMVSEPFLRVSYHPLNFLN